MASKNGNGKRSGVRRYATIAEMAAACNAPTRVALRIGGKTTGLKITLEGQPASYDLADLQTAVVIHGKGKDAGRVTGALPKVTFARDSEAKAKSEYTTDQVCHFLSAEFAYADGENLVELPEDIAAGKVTSEDAPETVEGTIS